MEVQAHLARPLDDLGPVNTNVEGSGSTYARRCLFSSLTTSPGRDTVVRPARDLPCAGVSLRSPLTVHLHHLYLVSTTQGCDTTTAWSRLSHQPRAVEARNSVTFLNWSTACRLRSQ